MRTDAAAAAIPERPEKGLMKPTCASACWKNASEKKTLHESRMQRTATNMRGRTVGAPLNNCPRRPR